MRHEMLQGPGGHSLDELLYYMRSVAGRSDNEWERNFARSMLRHGKRTTWHPSPKQERIMRRMVSEMLTDEDASLIDDESTDEGGRFNHA
ncbi:hypothetical protein [Oceanicella sp. SM1341]|uniref:hypothetical protein n=1 Tax=Oceanicella sp. SM1341 TaxID=1548889 RepID=UPI001E445BF6|nr:hypothetical protein [Oceanicella sp. SM1341]